jgi:glyoxylase-like metal-dependent hydrolase (beta-lactamase superfamily II)
VVSRRTIPETIFWEINRKNGFYSGIMILFYVLHNDNFSEVEMAYKKINRNTYYIEGATNIGVYAFKNKNCLLIDSGFGRSVAHSVDTLITENSLHPKYIFNTHCHVDHCGGNVWFKEKYPGIEVFSSQEEKIFIENPAYLYYISNAAYPSRKLKVRKADVVNFTVDEGIEKINDMKFSFIKTPGHSEGDLIIITPDRVAFMGDALFSTHTLEKHALTYLLKVDDRLRSLEKIKLIDADYFVISHAPEIVLKSDLSDLVELNIQSIYTMVDEIKEICNQPVSREDILQNILLLHDMECDYKGYLVNLCSVSAFLNYMLDEKILDVSVEDGKLYYY